MMIDNKAVNDLKSSLTTPRMKTQKESLAQEVYEILLNMLTNREILPGTVLNRREVAKNLGVSVAPVLEAFIRLELEGFVVSLPRKGTIVSPFGLRDVFDNLIFREALECQAARMYCGEPVKRNLERLLPLAVNIDSTFVTSWENWQMEYEFHGKLIALAGCQSLTNEFSHMLKLGMFYEIYNLFSNGEYNNLFINLHQDLLMKLTNPDPDKAEAAMRCHLSTTRDSIEQKLMRSE